MRFAWLALVLAWTAAPSAQAQVAPPVYLAVDPPPAPRPEDSMTPQQRYEYLRRVALDTSETRERREEAYRSVLGLLRHPANAEALSAWRERWNAFVREQETAIQADWARTQQQQPTLCEPNGALPSTMEAWDELCGRMVWDVVWENRMMAEAASLRNDQRARLRYREATLIAESSGRPFLPRWMDLVDESMSLGLTDEALRLCAPVRSPGSYFSLQSRELLVRATSRCAEIPGSAP